MKRSISVAWATLVIVLTTPTFVLADLELFLRTFPETPLGDPPALRDSVVRYNFDFSAGLGDSGQPPPPSASIPFGLSFDWRLTDTNAVVSAFDRTTLAGLPGIPAGAPFWTFSLGLDTGFMTDVNSQFDGVLNLQLYLRGEHLVGPNSRDPQDLPLIRSTPVSVGKDEVVETKGARSEQEHPHTDGSQGIDRYGFRAAFVVGTDINLPLSSILTAENVGIFAQHLQLATPPPSTPVKPGKRTGMTLGAGESFAFFDADSNSLFMSSGQVTDLQNQPSNSFSASSGITSASLVDAEWASDPLLDFSVFRISSPAGFDAVSYTGFDSDRGVHVFGGGELAVEHLFNSGDFTLEATFEELLYHAETGDFTAVLNTVNYTDFPLRDGYSAFLDQFTDEHLFGDDPSSRGVMFTFNYPDLAEATNNFTETFFSADPTAFLLTGILIPEPTSLALFSGLVLGLCGWRRMVSECERNNCA